MLARFASGWLRNRKRIEVGVVTPLSVFPLRWLSHGPIAVNLETEIIKRIGPKFLALRVLPFDAVDMNAEQAIATLDALHNFITNPAPGPSMGTDQYGRHGSVLQFRVNETLQC